jgi:hypothetical protein
MIRPLIAALLLIPAPLLAQAAAPADSIQISAAVAPLPEAFRSTARIMGHGAPGSPLREIRPGTGAFVCLADDPNERRFHTACYHRDLEPFMARGRALRAEGHTTDVDSIRFREISAGTLDMPRHPSALYSLSGDSTSFNAANGVITGARRLYVVYIPFATAESTGIPAQPAPNAPWIMFPGTPKAHIMFVPQM